MKIGYFCLKHPPTDGRVYHKISKALKKQGHEVIGIHPNIDNVVTHDDIHLLGYPQKSGVWGRIRSFNKIRAVAIAQHLDILIAAEPDSLYAARAVKRAQKHVQVVFDCHEWYGEHYNSRIQSRFLKKVISSIIPWWINSMVKRCDAVISVNDTMAQYYAQFNSKSYTIPSIADVVFEPDLDKMSRDFIFFGNFLISEQEDILLRAAMLLKEKNNDARIVIIGGTRKPEAFRRRIEENDVANNIAIMGWLTRDQAFKRLNEGCAGIMRFDMQHYNDHPALPNKIFEYMAVGMAIIGCKLNPEIGQIIEDENCGIAIDEETPEALANAIIYLTENTDVCLQMGQNAYRAVQETYNWDNYGNLLNDIMVEVASTEG